MMLDARDILNQWLDGVNLGDAAAVLALYSEDATLLPTFSDTIRRGLGDIENYFDTLSQADYVQVNLQPDTLAVQAGNGATVCLSGEYEWVFDPNDASRTVLARFTYVVDCSAQRPIVHHHSSRVPEQR